MKRQEAVKHIAERLELADNEALERARQQANEAVRVELKERDYRSEAEDLFDSVLNRLVRNEACRIIDERRNGVPMAPAPAIPPQPAPWPASR